MTEVALLSSSSLRARTGDLAAAVDRFAELLDHFGVGGDPGHLVTSLRNLVTLLVRLGQYRPAAALYGTVVDHPSSPTYGAEAERLEAAAEECRDASATRSSPGSSSSAGAIARDGPGRRRRGAAGGAGPGR